MKTKIVLSQQIILVNEINVEAGYNYHEKSINTIQFPEDNQELVCSKKTQSC
jgi:hypothetical protein